MGVLLPRLAEEIATVKYPDAVQPCEPMVALPDDGARSAIVSRTLTKRRHSSSANTNRVASKHHTDRYGSQATDHSAATPGSVSVSNPGPLLKVEHLRVEVPTRRGNLVAIDDVSFEIAPGEVLGVVGESGAGKSLTGAAIIGLLEPPLRVAGGNITLGGRRIDRLSYNAMRRVRGKEIGAIFQDPLQASTRSIPSADN